MRRAALIMGGTLAVVGAAAFAGSRLRNSGSIAAVPAEDAHLRWQEWAHRSEFSDFSGPPDQVGTTYSDNTRLLGFTMRMTNEVVEVEPLRLCHEHSDDGPVDTVLRLQPDGDATRLVVECDYEVTGRLPGSAKDLMIRYWGERQARHMLEGFKNMAEAKARPA